MLQAQRGTRMSNGRSVLRVTRGLIPVARGAVSTAGRKTVTPLALENRQKPFDRLGVVSV